MNYTYLVASQPTLFFGDPPPFTAAVFLRRCEGMLAPAEVEVIAALLAGRPVSGPGFADGWQARETQLRNAVARARAAQAGVDARAFLKDHSGWDMTVAKAVADAFTKSNPLEREQELDRCRWHVADELALHDAFGFAAICAFAVKLRLAERWAALKDEDGRRVVEEFVKANAGLGLQTE